ncbi:Uncharacterized metal-binding protein YceD, DUF177 family [Sphingomonas laterariae]|uniref:Uncharacterized metal-binding protein YceD, DUF177 family n=1 Tax=Edaphosphingomonas laterariae TaxID=861865 RepID=A0A239FIM4_9SPHN|nr:DUF177 domain-containing protein [Sphingomonas laterariae]SNS56665.1 Uncharacterized metal-binding protein YceD, DUF177 family [Sphingomonas laterariae]
MTAPANELSRPIRLDTLGEGERAIEIETTVEERGALARRFGLIAIGALAADVRLHREGLSVMAEGRIRGEVEQPCIATGEPVPARIDESFRLRFVHEDQAGAAEEIELSEEDCDTVPFEGGLIDIGEAVAETLALALDPFPRSANADQVLKAAGVLQENEVETGPFAALKGLRDKLAR